jgi:hypothetical protein
MNECPKCTEQRTAVCPNGCDGAIVVSQAHIAQLEAENARLREVINSAASDLSGVGKVPRPSITCKDLRAALEESP